MRILLVVDDEPDLAPLFERLLSDSFDQIHFATGVAEAETVLGNAAVTHLVVDSILGNKAPSGPELVARWRSLHPSVAFSALFSGSTELREATLPGVDKVFIKPRGFEPLLDWLQDN